MNRKQLVILLIAVVVLAGIGIGIKMRRDASWESADATGERLLPELPLNRIAAVTIENAETALHIVRTDERWSVKERFGYPADTEKLSRLLRGLTYQEILQTVAVGPSQYGRLHLLEPSAGEKSGTRLALADDKDTALATVLFGKKHMQKNENANPMLGSEWPDGRFVMTPRNGKDQVFLLADTYSEVAPNATDWIDSEFFEIKKTTKVTRQGDHGWVLVNVGGKFVLDDLDQETEEMNTSPASSAGSAFSWGRFEDIVDPATPDAELGMDSPEVFVFETEAGVEYTVRIGTKTDDNQYPVRVAARAVLPETREAPEDESDEDKEKADKEFADKRETAAKEAQEVTDRLSAWTYLVAASNPEKLLKKRADFVKDKQPENSAADAPAAGAPPSTLPPTPLPTPPSAPPAPPPGTDAPDAPAQAPAPPDEQAL